MDKMNYPRGLVRYSTEHSMEKGETRILRPRIFVYATLLLILVGGLVTSMATRTPLILDVIRDRNFLYRELPDGEIENIYTLKVVNQREDAQNFRLSVEGVPGIELDGVADVVAVDGGAVLSLPVRARAPAEAAYGIMHISFTVTDVDDPSVTMTEDSRFLGPTP
jgi:polyferredoxin